MNSSSPTLRGHILSALIASWKADIRPNCFPDFPSQKEPISTLRMAPIDQIAMLTDVVQFIEYPKMPFLLYG